MRRKSVTLAAMPGTKRATERYLTTVLMTDIVDSTGHAAELGDTAWRELVGQHHRIVRASLRSHDGNELDTAGDGFFAIFDAPASAIAAALAIADQVRTLGIEIRAGIHTGEVEQAGPKVSGITVPIASRIMALAAPSQVLVSATVRDLAAGASLTFSEAGTHALKGVPGEWHVYAVQAAATDAEPALPSDEVARERRAAGVRRARSRPIWQRRPRLVALIACGTAAILLVGGLLIWQPWLTPALAQVESDSVGVIDVARSAIVASIKVDAQPGGLVAATGSAWVANTGADTVSQIDTGTRTQTRVIDVGRDPTGIVVAAGSAWVANSGDRTVTRINEISGKVTDTITVGNGPLAAAATADAVWVVNATDSTVSRIDATSGAVTTTVQVAAGPIAIAGDGASVWLASADGALISHLDGTTGVTLAAPIALSSRPTSIALGSAAVWVASADGTVTRIDPQTNRVTTTVDVGGSATSIVANEDGVWVADRNGYVLHLDATDPGAAPTRIATTNSPAALTFEGRDVWVATGSTAQSHRGGHMRIVGLELPDLDPSSFSPLAQLEADGLVAHRRAGGAAGGAVLADLATAVPRATEGGLKYVFQLRPGLRYSTGESVLASDFRRAIERSFTTELAYGNYLFTAVQGADACATADFKPVAVCDLQTGIAGDDLAGTVTFFLSRPDSDFIYSLASPLAYPAPPSVPATSAVDGPFPGTGPYTVTSHGDTHVTLGRNPNFVPWDDAVRADGFPDEIEWIVAGTADEAVAMVERGDADYLRLSESIRPSAETLTRIRSQLTGQLHYASNTVSSVTMNTAIAPFDSADARQALSMALDRAHIVEMRGGPSAALITCQFLPPGWPAYQPNCPYTTHPDPGGRWQAPDLNAARQLVASSGTSGTKVVVGPTLEAFADVRDYLVTVLQELGYDASADTRTDDEYINTAHFVDNRVQVSVLGWFAAKLAPSEFLFTLTCGQNTGLSNFCDPAYDALVAKAQELQGTDVAASVEKWAEADRYLVEFGRLGAALQ